MHHKGLLSQDDEPFIEACEKAADAGDADLQEHGLDG